MNDEGACILLVEFVCHCSSIQCQHDFKEASIRIYFRIIAQKNYRLHNIFCFEVFGFTDSFMTSEND